MINPQQLATQFATLDVQSQVDQLNRQQSTLNSESTALTTLQTSMTDFQTAIDGLNSTESGALVNAATVSNDAAATVTADSTAQPGSYSFYVESLASAQQFAYQGIADNDVPTSGVVSISLGDSEDVISIDLSTIDEDGDGLNSVSEFADAVNDSPDNPGVTASLVKSNGQTSLLLTSDDTGAANTLHVEMTNVPDSTFSQSLSAPQQLSPASDAVVYLGGDPETGLKMTNSSNTFDDLIEGVSITFNEVNAPNSSPVKVSISTDESASQEKVQTFVDAYNTLVDSLDSLTASGGGDDDATRGAMAGDAGITSFESQLRNYIRQDYDGVSLMDYGISADTDGHLEIDGTEFDEMMETNPEGLNSIFVGDDSLVGKLDASLDTFLNDDNGVIKMRQDAIDDSQERLDTSADSLQQRYDSAYNRYLTEYTNLMVTMTEMENTMAAFQA